MSDTTIAVLATIPSALFFIGLFIHCHRIGTERLLIKKRIERLEYLYNDAYLSRDTTRMSIYRELINFERDSLIVKD